MVWTRLSLLLVNSMDLLTLLPCLLLVCSAAADPPNIIVIVGDDWGWNDVSFHGSDQIPTPNLDRLAREGVILNNYYVQPICTPTRSALMTGRYPIHTGMQSGVIIGAARYGLGLDEKILPQYLTELGYSSHAVGKWHLGFFAKEYTPTYRGFRSFFGIYQGESDYWDHTLLGGSSVGEWGLDFHDDVDGDLRTAREYFGQYATDVYRDKTVDIIRNHNTSQPLFLYLAQQGIHCGNKYPCQEAQNKYYQRLQHITDHQRRMVAAMAVNVDESVGEVYHALAERDMLSNSIIVFTSDNGGPVAHGTNNMASNWPLRGMKGNLFEGGVRVPGFVWSPLLKSSSRTSHQLLHVTDWLPTLLSAAGATKLNQTKPLDGQDQWAALSLNTDSQRHEILHNIERNGAVFGIRIGDFKLVSPNWTDRKKFGWYPPPGMNSTDTALKFTPKTDFDNNEQSEIEKYQYKNRYRHNPKYRNHSLAQIVELLSASSLKYSRRGERLVVDCGPKAPDADFNCRPGVPCLYHLLSDPCEYQNLYDTEPEVVWMMYERMLKYKDSSVPSRHKPQDPLGFPINNDFVWKPWVELNSKGKEVERNDDVIIGVA